MESKAKLAGHPIHQMLIVLPLGLLVMAVLFDIIRMFTGVTALATASYYNILAGVISGLVAAVFGLVDWLAIPQNTRAKSVGMWHGLGNVLVVVLFAVSWWLRRGEASFVPSNVAFSIGVVGLLLGAVTGWLGGELVDRLGVGVDPGANLDAPSSLKAPPPGGDLTTIRQRGTSV
jgi:uncharacterized membrane protein